MLLFLFLFKSLNIIFCLIFCTIMIWKFSWMLFLRYKCHLNLLITHKIFHLRTKFSLIHNHWFHFINLLIFLTLFSLTVILLRFLSICHHLTYFILNIIYLRNWFYLILNCLVNTCLSDIRWNHLNITY
jgi:hypothetical protein